MWIATLHSFLLKNFVDSRLQNLWKLSDEFDIRCGTETNLEQFGSVLLQCALNCTNAKVWHLHNNKARDVTIMTWFIHKRCSKFVMSRDRNGPCCRLKSIREFWKKDSQVIMMNLMLSLCLNWESHWVQLNHLYYYTLPLKKLGLKMADPEGRSIRKYSISVFFIM